MVRKSARFGQKLRELGVRPNGVVRIDSASKPESWALDPVNNTRLIAETFREACDVAADYGEKLAAEGEICWGGMHSWKTMIEYIGSSGSSEYRFPGRYVAYLIVSVRL